MSRHFIPRTFGGEPGVRGKKKPARGHRMSARGPSSFRAVQM
jgi:hypothetical protein